RRTNWGGPKGDRHGTRDHSVAARVTARRPGVRNSCVVVDRHRCVRCVPRVASPQPAVADRRTTHHSSGRVVPTRTTCPDEAGPPPTVCRVIVRVGKLLGGTPAHSVTSAPSLKVPIGTMTPAGFLSHAS